MDGPYAMEIATRMMLNGVQIKRLARDTEIEVEAWKYNQRPYVANATSDASGWRNRDVTLYPMTKTFKKDDTYIIYLAQPLIHQIPTYMEPDLPWNAASCIYLPYMSLALGGAGSGYLSPALVGVEMPAYRYLKEVDLPTYDMDHHTLLINRGAVTRFYSYQTQENIAAVSAATGEKYIKVYDYDIQVHARTNALVNGRFNVMLPTNRNTKGYLILRRNGTYEALVPNSTMAGWNVATVVVNDHGRVPFTINMNSLGNPIVGDGSNRTLAHALPPHDDLIGVRIVEIVESPLTIIFKDGKLPPNAVETENGFEYPGMFTGKGTLLSDKMLDGWRITGVTPNSGKNWKADIINGEVVITFKGDVYDETVTVTVTKDGSFETRDIEITFSGEKESLFGCNAGLAMLALLAVFPVFMRRKD